MSPAAAIFCAIIACGLFAAGVFASVVDVRTRTIPNGCSAAVAVLGVLLCALRLCAPVGMALPAPALCMACAVALLLLGWAAEAAHRALVGRVGMGLGDVKYVAAWACALGWWVAPALACACLGGAAWASVRGERAFAMAPWLTLAFGAALLVGLLGLV